MKSEILQSRLQNILHLLSGTSIAVVGDIVLDRYVWGKVERISPEAPVVVVQVVREDERLGGAGNVVNNLVELGAAVKLCGVVGNDSAGCSIRTQLEHLSVNHDGVLIDETRTTTIKTRVIAHHQQVVRIDREVAKPIEKDLAERMADAVETNLSRSRALVVSDYGKGAIGQAMFRKIQRGYEKGELGLGKLPIVVDPKAPHFELYSHATIIKPNRKEAEEASGRMIKTRADAVDAARVLKSKWGCEVVMITLGEDGMVLLSVYDGKEQVLEVETEAREVFDVSGAGDTVSAVFALCLAVGGSLHEAAVLSNIAAGIVVGEVGTVPIQKRQMEKALGM